MRNRIINQQWHSVFTA